MPGCQEEVHMLRARAGNQPTAVASPTKKAGGKKKKNPSDGKEADKPDTAVDKKVSYSSPYWCSRNHNVHCVATKSNQTY